MVQVDRIKKPKTQKEAFTRIEIEKMREAIEVVSPKRNIARDKALIELLLSRLSCDRGIRNRNR